MSESATTTGYPIDTLASLPGSKTVYKLVSVSPNGYEAWISQNGRNTQLRLDSIGRLVAQ